jgi:hypothetical protein
MLRPDHQEELTIREEIWLELKPIDRKYLSLFHSHFLFFPQIFLLNIRIIYNFAFSERKC